MFHFILWLEKKVRKSKVNKKKKKAIGNYKDVPECVYKHYSRESELILMNYFPYFHLLRNYSNYHFQFLVIKNEYICKDKSIFYYLCKHTYKIFEKRDSS